MIAIPTKCPILSKRDPRIGSSGPIQRLFGAHPESLPGTPPAARFSRMARRRLSRVFSFKYGKSAWGQPAGPIDPVLVPARAAT